MKGFERKNRYFSLCGLNCALCPMYVGGYCPSCGGGAGNQSCRIAKCSIEQGGIEFCFECKKYPCEHYGEEDVVDSFITYRNRRADAERAKKDIRSYIREQEEKEKILLWLLSECNDGRRKTLFCTAVNLLSLHQLESYIQNQSNDRFARFSLQQWILNLVKHIKFCLSIRKAGIVLSMKAARIMYIRPKCLKL